MVARSLMTVMAAGIAMMGLVSAARADMGPIESRQACMKANGAAIGLMVKMVKGETAYDKAAVDAALANEEKACAGWANWWGEDTKMGGAVKTRAADAIWTDKAGFEAAGAEFGKARAAVVASTDLASLKAAVPAFGKSCQGCHEKFRAPEQ